jgi:flagellin
MGDTDYAKASSDLIRQQMIGQSTQAMQAQANAAPQQVLSLLR